MSTSTVQFYGPLYGSLYFAAVMTTAFYGVMCIQTFFYYVHHPNDPLALKILAGLTWALNTIHEALTVAGVYKYIIAGLVDPSSFTVLNPELVIVYLPTALLLIFTQGFLVHRIYILGGKKIVVPLVWVVPAVVELVCGCMYVLKSVYIADGGVHVVGVSTLDSGLVELSGIIAMSVAAGIDVMIAAFMTFLLSREWRVTKFKRTAHLLQRLTIFAVNTGTWTAVYALLIIILLRLFPTKLYYTIFSVPLCSVYCNTILANLNARSFIGGESTGGTAIDSTIFDLDLPASSTLRPRVSDNTRGNKQYGEAGLVSSGSQGVQVCKTIEVLTFSEADEPTTGRMCEPVVF